MIPGYYWILLTANPVRNADTAADSMTRQRVFILWSGMARNLPEIFFLGNCRHIHGYKGAAIPASPDMHWGCRWWRW